MAISRLEHEILTLFNRIAVGAVVVEAGHILESNPRVGELLCLDGAQIRGESPLPGDWQVSTPDGHQLDLEHLFSIADPPPQSGSERTSALIELTRPREGGRSWLLLESASLPGESADTPSRIQLLRDVSLEVGSDEARWELDQALSALHEGVAVLRLVPVGYEVAYVNPGFSALTGYRREELLGHTLECLKGPDPEQSWSLRIARCLESGVPQREEMTHRCKNGDALTNDVLLIPRSRSGRGITHVIVVMQDVTAHQSTLKRIEQLTYYDSVTGLPNRNLLLERMRQAFLQATRARERVAVVHLDISRFRQIVSTLGIQVADTLLRLVADRIRATVRDSDTVARLDGDQFIALLHSVRAVEDVARVVEKVQAALREGFPLQEDRFCLTSTVGIALFPSDAEDPDQILQAASSALQRVKQHSTGRYGFFTREADARAHARLRLENRLRAALEDGELVLHYQPQIDMSDGHVVGVEALARWFARDGTVVPPSAFIPVAEESGLIVPLGDWALREACRQCQEWTTDGHTALRVAVNLSARQLVQPGFVDAVTRIVRESELAPERLELELTESSIYTNTDEIIQILRALRRQGIHISLDDFGTGYSSLTHLRRFPIDTLKIDQSFVQGSRSATEESIDAHIVGALVQMAHGLKLRVIAEGVETLEQLAMLRAMRCHEMQGYLVSRPVPASEISLLLERRAGLLD